MAKRWTDEKLGFLKNNKTLTYEEMAKYLGRTINSVTLKYQRLGLVENFNPDDLVDKKHRIWTVEHNEYLKANFKNMEDQQIAKFLNRSVGSVRGQLNRLGLKKRSGYLSNIGKRFNKLVIQDVKRIKSKYSYQTWDYIAEYICDCGNVGKTELYSIKSQNTSSCGCIEGGFKHGMYKTKIYAKWKSMVGRCHQATEGTLHWKNYQSRGITVCEEWRKDFLVFHKWATANGYDDKLTIERKDVNGNYCPENCTFITRKAQEYNKRNSTYVTIRGVRKSVSEWADDPNCAVSMSTFRSRLDSGVKPEDAFDTPAWSKKKFNKS